MLNSNSTYQEVFTELSNKMKYGAPEIKGLYQNFLAKGLLAAIVIHAILISGYFYSLSFTDAKAEDNPVPKIIKVLPFNMPVEKEKSNIADLEVIKVKDLRSLIPDPVRKMDVIENVTMKSLRELEEIDGLTSSEGTEDKSGLSSNLGMTEKLDDVKITEGVKKTGENQKDHQTFEVDRAPVAVNLSSIKSNLVYPEIALRSEIQGKIIVRVLVGKDGNVMRVMRVSGPEVFYEEVSEKVLGLKFTQALMNNEPVNCWVNVPFSFVLKSKVKEDTEEEGDN